MKAIKRGVFLWGFMLSIVFGFFHYEGFTQTTDVLDNNPPRVKWRQIKTPEFNFIYPENYENQAQRVAMRMQHIHGPGSRTLNTRPRRYPIVLQNQSAISNGFVTLGPRRSEFFTMPPQNYNFLGTNDWMDLLAVHEYRHMVQFDHSRRGFNKLFSWVFGENTQAAWAIMAAPLWFWEGDAVAMETALTPSGRGRIPDFDRMFRSNLMEGKKFGYHKQYLRSFKDFVPNHYVFGYHMVTHMRRKTEDPFIWGSITGKAFSVPFMPFTFSNSIKSNTGKYVVSHYREMMDELEDLWGHQQEGLELTEFDRISERPRDVFTEYSFPQVLPDGRILALKSGLSDFQHIVMMDVFGNEEVLVVPGQINNTGMLDVSGETVYWNEFEFDPRWRMVTYSVIKSYNLSDGKIRRLTRGTRYGGVAANSDGTLLATIETNQEGKNNVMVIDANIGIGKMAFSNPENHFYIHPRWFPDEDKFVAIKLTDEGKTITLFDPDTKTQEDLMPVTEHNLGHPVPVGEYILYNSPQSGIDNIYALHPASGRQYQVTSSQYGAYNPSVDAEMNYIYYNDHSKYGLDIVAMSFDPGSWKTLEAVEDRNVNYYKPLVEQEGNPDLVRTALMGTLPSKPYKKASGLFNPHSWGPFFTGDLLTWEFGLFSRDILNFNSLYAGYNYNIEEGVGTVKARYSYQGFFPILDIEGSYGRRSTFTRFRDAEGEIQIANFNWEETTIKPGVRIPLVTTRSKYIGNATFTNNVGITQVRNFTNDIADGTGRFIPIDTLDDGRISGILDRFILDNGNLRYNELILSGFRLHKRAPRDLFSRWGQTFILEHRRTAYGSDFNGSLLAMRSNLFFPSPLALLSSEAFKHHHLFFSLGYQSRLFENEFDNYIFPNRIPLPRGFSYPSFSRSMSGSANYAFPLWYPDINLGPVLNIQRFKTTLFYDMGMGSNTLTGIESTLYQSIGGELRMDFNLMRFLELLEVGVRITYGIPNPRDSGGLMMEFILANIGI